MSNELEIFRINHNRAMGMAKIADRYKQKQSPELAKIHLQLALYYEKLCTKDLKWRFDLEPSRSTIFRSAASLAIECGEPEEAKKLIASGLEGNPPCIIADDMRDLLNGITKREKQAKMIYFYDLTDLEYQWAINQEKKIYRIIKTEIVPGPHLWEDYAAIQKVVDWFKKNDYIDLFIQMLCGIENVPNTVYREIALRKSVYAWFEAVCCVMRQVENITHVKED